MMRVISRGSGILCLIAVLALPGSASAQQSEAANPNSPNPNIIVNGERLPDPSRMTPGPEIKGVISARNTGRMKVTAADGTSTVIAITDATRIKAGGGLFGGGSGNLAPSALLNGLPVTVKTLQSGDTLVASQITFRNNDLKTATMIRHGTAQQFEEQTAATEALRGRMGDIDKYNVKSTTNVYFDTDEFNQQLSEKRAGSVIHYLQQVCHWKPYRMLTPTGMAKADPLASNDTAEGKAKNRRVSVNILVSKSVDGL
jgi:hypothetical protein